MAASKQQQLTERLAAEQAMLDSVQEQVAVHNALLDEILDLREQLAELTAADTEVLRAEVAGLVAEVVALEALERTTRRRREKKLRSVRCATDVDRVAFLEGTVREHQGRDVVITEGVYVKPGMDAEAIRRIQRAKGIRR